MSAFVWTFWRVGWAPDGTTAVEGWSRLWWRLWWRGRAPVPAKDVPARLPLDLPHLAPPMLHLLDQLTSRPVCGASVRETWTIEPESATCSECRRQSEMARLQWFVNNR